MGCLPGRLGSRRGASMVAFNEYKIRHVAMSCRFVNGGSLDISGLQGEKDRSNSSISHLGSDAAVNTAQSVKRQWTMHSGSQVTRRCFSYSAWALYLMRLRYTVNAPDTLDARRTVLRFQRRPPRAPCKQQRVALGKLKSRDGRRSRSIHCPEQWKRWKQAK